MFKYKSLIITKINEIQQNRTKTNKQTQTLKIDPWEIHILKLPDGDFHRAVIHIFRESKNRLRLTVENYKAQKE